MVKITAIARKDVGNKPASLYIANLPFKHSVWDLEDMLMEHGSCVIRDRNTYAFVDYKKVHEASAALAALQGHFFETKPMFV